MSSEDHNLAERLPPELRHGTLGPILQDAIRRQDMIRDALRTYDLSRTFVDEDIWRRIHEGLLSSTTWAMTEGLNSRAQKIRASLLPLQIEPMWDPGAMRSILAGMSSVSRLAETVPDLSGWQQYRELTLGLAELPALDMTQMFPTIRVLDDALLRATELRAAISAREEFLTPQLGQLVGGLDRVSDSLADMWRTARLDPERWLAYPSFIREGPPIALFEAARSTGALVEVEEPLLEGPEPEDELDLEEAELTPRLSALGQAYVDRYSGAIAGMRGGGPDWFRHASVSMRELILDLMRVLAPDEAVFSWNPGAPTDDAGKPTYRARLDYIFRDMGEEFAAYAATDNDHIRQTVIALNAGTHSPDAPFGETAQRSTILRSQYATLYLLSAAH